MKTNPAKIRNRLLRNVGIQVPSADSFDNEGETLTVSPSPASTTDLLKDIGGNSGVALITTSFDRFIKEQSDAITAIDNDTDGFTKGQKYSDSRNGAKEKMDMYRRVFETSKVLDGDTMKKGLELLDTLDGIYEERIGTYTLPEGIDTREKYNDALRQAKYYQKYGNMSDEERASAEADLKKRTSEYMIPGINEEYEWLKAYDAYEGYRTFDVEAGQKEIDELESISNHYTKFTDEIKRKEEKLAELEDILSIDPDNGGAIMDIQTVRGELEALYIQRDALGDYGDDINSYINEKRMFLKQAKDTQALAGYEKLRRNADFAEKSTYNTDGAKGMYFLINSKKHSRYDENGRKKYNSKLENDSSAINYYKDRNYDMMNDDEIAMYNYLYNTSGESEAQKYLDALQYTLNARHAGRIVGETDTTLEKLLFAAEAGADQFSGGIRSLFDEEYALTPSSAQLASGEIRKDMGKVSGFFYDVINTTTNQLPSVITSIGLGFINPTLGAAAGTTLMGASAAGNGYAQMRQLGYTKEQSASYGLLTGISEVALEKALGGISKLGGLPTKGISNMVKGIDNAAGRIAVNVGLSSLSEAGEEGLQSILEQTIIRNIALGESNGLSDVEWSEVVYSALLGGISGGVMEGGTNAIPDSISRIRSYKDEGACIISGGMTSSVIELATGALDGLDPRMAAKLGEAITNVQKDPTAKNVGRLAYAVNDARVYHNTADITSALVDRGMDSRTAEDVAARFSEIIEGGEFTRSESKKLNPESRKYDETYSDAARDLIYSPESSVAERNRAYADVLNGEGDVDAGRQYSISYDRNNKPFAVIDTDILAGVPESDWVKTVKTELKNKFPNGVTIGNKNILITGKSRNELTNSKTSKKLRHVDKTVYRDKLSSLEYADDIMEVAQPYTSETPNHPRTDDLIGFERGYANIQIGNNEYSAEVVVGESKNGTYRLHDIVNLTPITIQHKFSDTNIKTPEHSQGMTEESILKKQPMDSSVDPLTGEEGERYSTDVSGNISDGRYRSTEYNGSNVSDNSISHPDGSVNTPYYSDSVVTSPEERVRETRESAAAQDISAEDVAAFERAAEEFGVSIVFGEWDPDVGGDGYYENGTIYLNRNAYDPIAVVFAHELSHHAERAGWWNSYKDLALREMQRITGKDLDTLRVEVTELYARHGKKLSTVGADAEIVAQFTQEHILGNSEDLGRICEENPSLMQKVLDFIVTFLEKIGIINEDTRRIDRARRTLAGALRDVKGSRKGSRSVQYKTTDSNNTTAEKLSYQNLVNKPDMPLCEIDDVVSVTKPTSQMRKDALNEALDNAREIGITDENGGVSVYVEDIGSNILLSKKGLKHGLDSRFSENLPATLRAGEILSNAIKINELLPQLDSANKTLVLLGAAKSRSGNLSLVRFVVNSYTGEVDSINVLYALTTKKESAVLNAPRLTGNPLSITDSRISISQLLDYVNKYFPDILPESVLKHYGHTSRPDGVLGKNALYSFSRSAGSLDADTVAEAERMESEGYTEDEIYDAVGLWKDSETGRWMMDADANGIEKYRSEPELNDGRRNGVVADPDVFGGVITEAERMEDAGNGSAAIWEDLGLWRNSKTGEWMTYDSEPRFAPYAGRLSPEEYAAKSEGFYEDQVDVYRDIVEEARRASEERALGSEDEALAVAEQQRKEISLARGDLALDGIEYAVQEAISEELETEMYDVAEALTEAEEARIEAEYILAESSGKQVASVQDRNEAQFEAAEEARRAGEEYYFVRGNTGEITAKDEAFAYGPGEDLSEEVFNAIMEADAERRDSALASVISKSDSLVRNTKYGAENYEEFEGELEVEAAKRDIATRTILRIVDDNGVIASRTGEISKYAGQIARGLYPMSKDSQYIYKMLVDQDKTDGSFVNDIELYEDRLERGKADLEAAKQGRGSETEELISEARKRIERYEKKLEELRTDREKYWNETEGKILDFVEDLSEVDLDEPYMYDWYLDSKNTALGDARFWFEYGAPAKELALNILAATDSLTGKTEREAIASKIAFLNREIKKQESHMDKGSISAAEKLAVEGYIESDSDDVHYLADLYRSLRALSAGEHSTALRNLSVMIDSPITSKYGTAAEFRMSAVRRDRLEREARRMAHKLAPGEKKIAKDIAEGNRLPSEIPQEFDSAKIMRFANLWKAYQSEISQSKNIQKFRARTAEEYRNSLKEMIGKNSIMKIGWFGTPKLNLLTPERAMRYAFGDTLGGKLADELIYPIHRNEAERIRFINRLLKDFNSRFGKISKSESGHVQRLGESGATLELYDKGEIEARNEGYGYWEYAGLRRNKFKDVTAELLHRETLGHMERLNHDTISDSFWDDLEKDLAAAYTEELIDTRTAELKEKARVKHKETPENISNKDMEKFVDEARESARDEVSRLRDNETAYKSGEFSKKDIKELRKMVEETSPEDVLWNIKTELDEYAAEHIRKGDGSAEAQAERDSYVDREIRRRLMISDNMCQMYNMLFDGINDMLVSHGYDPVSFRRNYFPHIQPESTNGISKLLSSFGFHPEVTALPAQLAGRTEVFKPGHRWAPFMQRRVGNTTDFDAVKGFEGYLNYASDIIYHMDDIQKLRGFSTLIRTENSTDEIKAQVGKLQDDFLSGKITRQELDEKREDLLNKAKLTGDAGKFVTWLDDYTNVLAGKQAAFDRGIEHLLGRTALNAGQALQTIYTRSAVLGNLSSALMNFSQLPMGISIAGTKNMIRAMEDMVTGRLNELYNFDERSDFLTGKKGVMKISQKGKMETWQDFLGGLFGATDDIAVRLMQRALFYELVDSGMTVDEAIIRSDRLCQAIMASRTKGARPLAFESKNFFLRGATMFQLEIENSLSFVHEDLVHEMKEIHGKKWKTKLAQTIITYLVAAWLLDMGFEEWLGKSPVPMDIIGIVLNTVASMFGSSQREIVHNILNGTGSSDDLEFKGVEGVLDSLAAFGKEAADDLPFISSVGQMLGITEGRMPMLDFSPIWEDIGPGIYSAILPKGATEEERDKTRKEGLMDAGMGAIEIVKGLFPGGSQIYKTGMGIVSLVQGGVYDNSGNLKYPVERDTKTIAQGVLFGPNALSATDEYYASGGRAYSEGETVLIADLEATGMSMNEAADIIDLLDEAGAKESSTDDEEYTFTGDGYADLNALLFSDDTDEDEPTAKEEALAVLKDLGLTPEQEYLIYREKIASPKEVTLLDAIDYTGGDPVASAAVLMGMRECDKDGEKLQYLMDSPIDDIDAAMVFYGMLATEKERAAFDMLRDGQMEKSDDIFQTLANQKRIENIPTEELKAEGYANCKAARYECLQESPITEFSKSAYYYEHLATETDKDALDELDKLGSDMSKLYGVVADVRFAKNNGEKYGILIDSNITGDEQYAILKYSITSKNNREDLDKDIDDVIAAGGTVDEYLAAKEAVYGLESDKDRNGKAIKNSLSKKKLRAIREALPDADYSVLVVLYEICGVSKSVYQKKNTGGLLGNGGLLGSKNKLGSEGLLGNRGLLGSKVILR